ncbi:unnamed protein product [Linum trigynum]|uniref:Uncharacterized protein n=1 Tax=Linum trigynum TaxID=586398 RepID=A0AAV2D8E9_9ROSI
MVEVNYMEIPTKVTMILIPIFNTKSKVKVIINLTRHMKKKFNQTMPTNPNTTSNQAVVVFTTTIMELMKVPFMSWIRWKMPCQHQSVTPPMKKERTMSVQTAPTLLKVLMIQDQSQTQIRMMRWLMTVYQSPTYNHNPDGDWMVDSDMEPPEVPIWAPLTRFMKGQQFGSKKEVRHAIDTEAI